MKGIAEEMRGCWNLDRQKEMGAFPLDGPDGDPAEHGTFGNLFSTEENGAPRPRLLGPGSAPPAVRFCLGPGSGAAPRAPPTAPPASVWDSRIEEVMGREETGSSSAPLDGWSH